MNATKQRKVLEILFPSTVLLLAALVSLLLPHTADSFYIKWTKFDESLGHGFLLITIVVYYLYKHSKSPQYKQDSKVFSTCALFFFLTFIVANKVFSFWGILLFEQFAFYFAWLSSVLFFLGKRYSLQIIFPLLFFIFAIPFWEFFVPFFVELTTIAVSFFLQFSDLTVFIHSNFIETPFGIIEVAKGCSGIRYFEIGLALAVLSAQEENFPWRVKLIIVLVGGLLGIITNWIRVLGLVYVGYWSEMTSNLMRDHEYYGFLLFFGVISGLIFFVNWLRPRYSLDTSSNASIKKAPIKYRTFAIKLVAIAASSLLVSYSLNALLIQKQNHLINLSKFETPAYPVLSNFGLYNQQIQNFNLSEKKCTFISRQYEFVESGNNVLPYDKIYNTKNFKLNNKTNHSLDIEQKAFIVNKMTLTSRTLGESGDLYYWYEYNNIKIQNKYIAKLFEVSYLIGSNEKMKLQSIWCSSN